MLIHAREKTERKGIKELRPEPKKIQGKYNQPLGGHGNRQVAPEKLLWGRSFTTLMFIRSCPS